MLNLSYDYASCVRSSEKVSWHLDDVMPEGTRLDFSRPFLPGALAAASDALPFLAARDARALNQIMGNAYLNLFAFVEEYILATVVRQAQTALTGDHDAVRALVRFADEEAKHQALFRRFATAFARDFGHRCEVLGDAAEVAKVILDKRPIAVMLLTLALEIMTQAHYVECVKDDQAVDPFFAKILRFHWLEESQHARIDALELDRMLDVASRAAIEAAFADYLQVVDAFDALLHEQARMDARTLAAAAGRAFDVDQDVQIVRVQHAAYRRTFLAYGMRHPTFVDIVQKVWPEGAARVKERAAQLVGR